MEAKCFPGISLGLLLINTPVQSGFTLRIGWIALTQNGTFGSDKSR
jgi:hypothetical protein